VSTRSCPACWACAGSTRGGLRRAACFPSLPDVIGAQPLRDDLRPVPDPVNQVPGGGPERRDGLAAATEAGQPPPGPVITDRWHHTSDGARAPALMGMTHTGVMHRAYMERPSGDVPPSGPDVRIPPCANDSRVGLALRPPELASCHCFADNAHFIRRLAAGARIRSWARRVPGVPAVDRGATLE
jgi:hypothetical protein